MFPLHRVPVFSLTFVFALQADCNRQSKHDLLIPDSGRLPQAAFLVSLSLHNAHTHTCVQTHKHTYKQTHLCIHKCRVCKHTNKHIGVYTNAHTHVHKHTNIHKNKHICIYTNTHTHGKRRILWSGPFWSVLLCARLMHPLKHEHSMCAII